MYCRLNIIHSKVEAVTDNKQDYLGYWLGNALSAKGQTETCNMIGMPLTGEIIIYQSEVTSRKMFY